MVFAAPSVTKADDTEFTPSVDLHGDMQNRLYANPDTSARFACERVSLSAVGHIAPTQTAYVEIDYQPWVTNNTGPTYPNTANQLTPPIINNEGQNITTAQGTVYLESAYWDTALGTGDLRIGKGRDLNFGLTPSYPNRKMTEYSILEETFTQDRIQGMHDTYKKHKLDGGVTFFTDNRLEFRTIGDFPATFDELIQHYCNHFAMRTISPRTAASWP